LPKKNLLRFSKLWGALTDAAEARTVAIVCCAYVEDALVEAISFRLPGANAALRSRLFGDGGPLSTVGAKIDMGRALDIIGGEERRLLIQIARTRNRFAHQIDVDSFDHPDVAILLDDMPLGEHKLREYNESFLGADAKESAQTRRERFTCISLLLCMGLHNFINAEHGPRYAMKAGK
jgi:hypothetical protein